MSNYVAPLRDQMFVLNELIGLEEICALPGNEECSPDLVESILDEAAKLPVACLIRSTAAATARRRLARMALSPRRLASRTLTSCSAKPAGWPCRSIRSLAVKACRLWSPWRSMKWEIGQHGFRPVPDVDRRCHRSHRPSRLRRTEAEVPAEDGRRHLVGTMNLTEPNAGSDLAAIASKAKAVGDGTYLVSGTKIFITWGENDCAENIIHLVLARPPDAPPGLKGISLFLVPKFLVNDDGSLGARNDLICASIEHKLGIHGSPTAVSVPRREGQLRRLPDRRRNKGVGYMFTMMNHARQRRP